MDYAAVVEAAFKASCSGLSFIADEKINDIQRKYRMELEGILSVLFEMLLNDDETLYKAVNSYLFKHAGRDASELGI